MSQASSEQHVLTENLWSLLGEVCRCIDRHVLAEALQPSQYSTAALIIDCLASLLNLAHALRTYQDDIGTWHELLQISYRLYLMNCAVVDKQLVLLVATLAACGRHQAETPEKQAYLQACVQLELLICDRSLKEGKGCSRRTRADLLTLLQYLRHGGRHQLGCLGVDGFECNRPARCAHRAVSNAAATLGPAPT